jgi:hypothetical protein
MSAVWVRRLTALFYGLAGLGAAVFVLSWPLHSRMAFGAGVCLMVCAVLIAALAYLADRDPQTRLLNIGSASWAVLFAVWCLGWLVVPALHIRWITLIGGLAFFAAACVLIYLHLQARRREKGKAARARSR